MTLFLHDLLSDKLVQFLLLLLLLLSLEYLSVVFVKKAITFSSKNFPNSLLLPLLPQLLLLLFQRALGIPLSSSQLPPVCVIREPLDLFHFVGLLALLFHLLSSRGVKLDCGKNKLLIKQIDTRTTSFLSSTMRDFARTLAHTFSMTKFFYTLHRTQYSKSRMTPPGSQSGRQAAMSNPRTGSSCASWHLPNRFLAPVQPKQSSSSTNRSSPRKITTSPWPTDSNLPEQIFAREKAAHRPLRRSVVQ